MSRFFGRFWRLLLTRPKFPLQESRFVLHRLNAAQVYLTWGAFDAFSRGAIYVVLAVYYVQSVGMNPLQLVLVGTVLELSCFVFQLPTGVIADTFSRKLSVCCGVFLVGVCFVAEGLLPTFGAILLAEIVRGLGETFISGALEAWIADEVGDENVGRVFIRNSQITSLTSMLGTVIGVGLANFVLNLPIVLCGALLVGESIFLLLAMTEPNFVSTPRGERTNWQMMSSTVREGVKVVRGRPILSSIIGISFFLGASSEGFDRLWEAHLLTNFTFPVLGELKLVVWFGIISVATGLLCLASVTLLRQRLNVVTSNQKGLVKALFWFKMLQIVAVLTFALTGNFAIAVGALWAKAVVGTLSGPLFDTWLIQNINPKVRATVLSLNSQFNALGQFTIGPIEGAIGTAFTTRAALSLSGIALSPTLLLYAAVMRRGKRAKTALAESTTIVEEQETSV